MQIFDWIYKIFIGLIIALAILLIVSMLPLPGNYKALSVLSGSMQPTIKTGSVVIVLPADDYKIGDIITFRSAKSKVPITHRIVEIQVNSGVPYYITKGDANNAPDSDLVLKKSIQGKVLFFIPFLGYILEFLRKPIGFILIIIVPALAIIIDEAIKIFKEVKNKKQSDAVENK